MSTTSSRGTFVKRLANNIKRTHVAISRKTSSRVVRGSPNRDRYIQALEIKHTPLQAPEDADLSSFTDWPTCWVDYVALIRILDDMWTMTARQGLLCSALHPEWTVLWQTGRLDISLDDDIDGIIEKLGRSLCLCRNPPLDRHIE